MNKNIMKKILLFIILVNISTVSSQSIQFADEPEIFLPGVISIENSEVKITFSKDGETVLWGAVGRENGLGGFDIWKSEKSEDEWSEPKAVSFNSADNDFDPCFSSDGKILYFFSNRSGGFGGDDIYFVEYDSSSRAFGEPVNMGVVFNTPGDEWGPTVSADNNKFLFCTDGLKGKGLHDIFLCERTQDEWSAPKPIDRINSAQDDFDPVFLHDNKTIIFSRKFSEDEAFLFISFLTEEGYSPPVRLGEQVNFSGTWNFGSSIDPSDESYFYYSTYIPDNSNGRLDIYRIKYKLLRDNK